MRSEHRFVFNSESVTEGHPDKLCDQISDAIVGHFLHQDPLSQVTAECCVSSGILFVAGKYRSRAAVDVPRIARNVIAQVGYESNGFAADSCTIMTSLTESTDLDLLPRDERELSDAELDALPAREQVTAFGFACDHTEAMIPLPIWLAHQLARALSRARTAGKLRYLLPDGKAQVGVEFQEGRPHRIQGITLIASHREAGLPAPREIQEDLRRQVIDKVFEEEPIRPDRNTIVAINPRGPMLTGGPSKHSGLTGRKTGMDTYGEFSRQSGAALSGKDPSRIERVATYAARFVAKNVVAAGLARQCEVQLSYSIGASQPVSIHAETFGTGKIPDADISKRIGQRFDLRPAALVREFDLRSLPKLRGSDFYQKLAAYGHVGRLELELPWEAVSKAATLREKTLKPA